jgi:two-component system NtrC family response regulator
MQQRILIIDEDVKFNTLLARMLSLERYVVSRAFDINTSLDILKKQPIDIVLLDAVFKDGESPHHIKQIKDEYPDIHIIILSTYPDIRDCVQSIKNGAEDYVVKDNDITTLLPLLIELFKKTEPVIDVHLNKEKKRTDSLFGFHNIIGNSDGIREAISLAEKVAATEATILLQGETGTGKELFANAIHNTSLRKNGPFIALNCSSFNKELLESELFGYIAGSFTGAVKDKKGLLEEANGGTLFLDEIGETDIDIQAKLLRVLETGELIKVGDTKVTKIDIRLISATHKDLLAEVKEKKFREDLFYRLNIFSIKLPALRERKQDILLLADYFIKLFSQKLSKHVVGMTKEYENLIKNYYWKGNIRELKNIIERSIILSEGIVLSEDILPYEILSYSPSVTGANGSSYALSVFERLHIHRVLTTTKWNKVEAARLLNISISTLYRKIEDYMLSAEIHNLRSNSLS